MTILRNVMDGIPDLCRMEATLTPALSALPAHARVWIYKSATPFTPDQLTVLREKGAAFTGSWSSHGDAVISAFDVLDNHFVVLAADLQDMVICGGAIDGSVQFIKQMEGELGLQLTDRMVVLYGQEGRIKACRATEVEGLLKSGKLNAETPVFDDLVATKADLDARFRTPLRNTWLSRYL